MSLIARITALAIAWCSMVSMTMHSQQVSSVQTASEDRVGTLLKKLTLQQKLDLIGGQDSFTRAEPTIGLPQLKLSDGPMGVASWGPSTAYAGGIALAATWDTGLAEVVGRSIGKDARSRGVHILLGPSVNFYRAPMCGRNFEYLGEDPWLAGQTASAYIRGVQSAGVIATVKHFALNNEEYDRHSVSSDVDERTLREIYLPAFEAAVKEGGVGAVMDSYNLVNGVHATENKHLNVDILKGSWGFSGIVMSDWDSTYSAVNAANAGLDLEMPSGRFMNSTNLMPAIKRGAVSEATIDDKVRRILREAVDFDFLGHDQTDVRIPRDSEDARKVALKEALESITLLKNSNHMLPLERNRLKTLAVLGPDAWPSVPGGGGSSQVEPFSAVSLLSGLSDALSGKVQVLYARGLSTPDELVESTRFESLKSYESHEPIRVETFDNPSFSGIPVVSYRSHFVRFPTADVDSASVRRSIRYTTRYSPTETEEYFFLAGAGDPESYKLMVDGRVAIEQTTHEGQAPQFVKLPLEAGKTVLIQIDYLPDSETARMAFAIRGMNELVSPEAKKIAAMADAAVVGVGFDNTTESEGMDRTFELPFGQNELIQSVAQVNPHTVVTITAGGGIDMRPWIDRVPAILHNWYPGQEGGRALAEILIGDYDPEGHLPISLENAWEDSPVHDSYYPSSHSEGQIAHVSYKEGVFLGYRYYTTYDKKPLFPFGFGMSYTDFQFSNLRITPDQPTADQPVSVTFDLTNRGEREGATVAQVYVGDPSARVKRPVKELKAFQKVRLAPGETRYVTLTLNRRSLAYWSDERNDWEVDPGRFIVYVGDSSDETPLTHSFQVR